MIETGIETICRRFNVLFDLLKKHGHDLEPSFRTEQKRWTDSFITLHQNLTNWELQHCG